jgi:hypothetical protein
MPSSTANEALLDIYRPIMFEDFERLKARALNMHKERV